MAGRGIEVTFDTSDFERGLAGLVSKMTGNAEKSLRGFASDAEKAVRSGAPSRSGSLRDSVGTEVARDLRGFYAQVEVGAFYASFIEFGTRHSPARPFFRPGIEQTLPGLRQRLMRLI